MQQGAHAHGSVNDHELATAGWVNTKTQSHCCSTTWPLAETASRETRSEARRSGLALHASSPVRGHVRKVIPEWVETCPTSRPAPATAAWSQRKARHIWSCGRVALGRNEEHPATRPHGARPPAMGPGRRPRQNRDKWQHKRANTLRRTSGPQQARGGSAVSSGRRCRRTRCPGRPTRRSIDSACAVRQKHNALGSQARGLPCFGGWQLPAQHQRTH